MKEFKVEITETLQRTITVIAKDENAAINEARDLYFDEEVVLDSDDYVDTDFEIVESEEN